MYQRAEPLPVPTSKRYIRIGFEDGPAYVFRRPGLDDLTRIVGRFDRATDDHRRAVHAVRELIGAEPTAEAMEKAAQASAEAVAAQAGVAFAAGYLIGRTWADTSWVLDANDLYEECAAGSKPYPESDGLDSWAAYGRDVYREVCDEVGGAEALELAVQVRTAIASWLSSTDAEVKRKAKVFPPT